MTINREGDAARLSALRSLQILDTPRQDCFDQITQHCVELFDCSISLISLVDEDRQWFLSPVGVHDRQTPREVSFCDHAVASGDSFLVPDTHVDARFKDNPLVLGDPRIRSYLGQPIAHSDGTLIGTLCVADPRPNHFGDTQRDRLATLAKIVEALIQAHHQRLEGAYLAAHLGERSNRLEKSNRVFKQAERVAKIGSWELDLETSKLIYSDEALAILGFDPEEAPELDLEEGMSLYEPEGRQDAEDALADIIATRGSGSVEAHIVANDGQRKRIKVSGEYLEDPDDSRARVVGIVQDISEAYHARLALQRAADYDALTGLQNRYAFDRRLAEQIKAYRSSGREFCVMLVDLDGFQDINDTFGHLVGDVILEEISTRIGKAIPSGAVAARWGGDEFAVITPLEVSQDQATKLGEDLIQTIADQVEISGRKVAVSATCGMVRASESSIARELMRMADLALYHGKKRERGRVHLYNAGLERANKLRQEAITTVRHALDEDRLFAGYQPIVQLSNNSLIGFEALMRLNTRAGEKLTATQVLPAILDPILSREIGERMVQIVSQDFSEIRAAQPGVQFISINATEADLLSRDYSDRLLSALEAKEIPPRYVTLEITETMLLVNDSLAVQIVLTKLRKAGMQIALDDFGTGFSSLSHLRDFPIDKVKIDGSFVQKMCSDHQSRLIVQALIGMAKNLGIKVIAEGIETEEQRTLLLEMGCYYGQGFLFSPAETACRLKTLQLVSPARPPLSAAAA